MKKVLSLTAAALVLSVTLLTGCASSGSTTTPVQSPAPTEAPAPADTNALKDGTYSATYDKADERGWKAQLEITVVDGKITEASYDEINGDGVKKSDDEAYNERMVGVAGVGPIEFIPELNQQLVDKQDADKVDTITGATSSTTLFKELAAAAIEKAKAGDATEAVIELKK
jgi:major membrane immunogen (membrane-anchored lipoprotein)